MVSTDKYTQFVKGRVLKQYKPSSGYLQVSVKVDGKWKMENVHRLVAQTYIPNPENLPEVNHKSCVKTDNRVKNLEWCTRKQNIAYREKYGTPAKYFVQKSPVYAVNLKTQEILWFESQMEASRVLGVSQGNIYSVIKGNRKQTHGFWFTNADGNAADAIKNKLEKV